MSAARFFITAMYLFCGFVLVNVGATKPPQSAEGGVLIGIGTLLFIRGLEVGWLRRDKEGRER